MPGDRKYDHVMKCDD